MALVLITAIQDLFTTVGFVLGFLIVPVWLLTFLNEQKNGVEATKRLLPTWMRVDFWAILRIFDRTFRAFFQGQFLLGLVNGVGMYLGLSLLEMLGWPVFPYKLSFALFVGFMQLIPSIGPFLEAMPLILAMIFRSFYVGASIIALYLVIQWLVNMLVLPHIERKMVNIHPAVLIVVIVALSELGIWWILLAAPVTVIIRDLFRYIYGRFNSPPQPVGLLPGEAYPLTTGATSSLSAEDPRIPLVYRRNRMLRQTESQ